MTKEKETIIRLTPITMSFFIGITLALMGAILNSLTMGTIGMGLMLLNMILTAIITRED